MVCFVARPVADAVVLLSPFRSDAGATAPELSAGGHRGGCRLENLREFILPNNAIDTDFWLLTACRNPSSACLDLATFFFAGIPRRPPPAPPSASSCRALSLNLRVCSPTFLNPHTRPWTGGKHAPAPVCGPHGLSGVIGVIRRAPSGLCRHPGPASSGIWHQQ